MNLERVGLIGYGEVGRIFCSELTRRAEVKSVAAWDLKFADPLQRKEQLAHAAQAGAQPMASMQSLCQASDLVISAVTASSTLAVAAEAVQHLRPGAIFLDLNSASPGTKRQCAALVDARGAHYVEAGVMTSVPPYGLRVPMLLGGAKAEPLSAALAAWGMDAKVVSREIGVASAIKMCRSVMIKGLEALVIESFTTARRYGVEQAVLETLKETFPGIDWPRQGAYFFSRVAQHGKRRAEEMREAANTVREAGFSPLMASATADKQAWVAAQAEHGVFQGLALDAPWQEFAERLIHGQR